ncbi:LysE/ArgO family amino acid transporter [Pseudoalteromonas ulvae]|uniref:Amino acid transporter n=1 Tax=Pseudoalteromonas ulvae TaxID=107327 RepID=A0A244CNQ2_PSEDV|nr:LysE/ArgO family amino acid transporter [Pseudoalteromonas ulvae]OUL57250.1 amino acid transporter [Pseudoalteromonas ulvae]
MLTTSLFIPLFQGLFLGASMILPLGAQNSHILRQGLMRNHHFSAATICMLCDVMLIGIGVFGGAALLATSPVLLTLITWAGIVFLLVYGGLSCRSAWQNNYQHSQANNQDSLTQTRFLVISTTLAVTLLNPHVYLDTVVILGSVGGQFDGTEKIAFAFGTMLASIIWFYSLAAAAAKLSPWLSQPKIRQIIDILVAIVMFLIALSLFKTLY